MRSKEAYIRMQHEIEQLQDQMKYKWLKDSLPDDWAGLDYYYPVKRKTTRVTLRLDADMVSWFRKLGPGYQQWMNLVMRIYYTALMSGHIKAYPRDNILPRFEKEAYRVVADAEADVDYEF